MNKTQFLIEIDNIFANCQDLNIRFTNRDLNKLYKKINYEFPEDVGTITGLKIFYHFKNEYEKTLSDSLRATIINQWFAVSERWGWSTLDHDDEMIPKIENNQIVEQENDEFDGEYWKDAVFAYLRGSKAKAWDFCRYFNKTINGY
tara:strand:- start:122 stop:559 length:438 start_codon:yes stop_codon:yes gene_type:complete